MRTSMIMCKKTHPLLSIPSRGLNKQVLLSIPQKEKVVVVMGATGTGKSRLSIDLASRFPAEIVNSDKMQVYEELDITTNKVSIEEQSQVPHHLLSIADPNVDFTAADFCQMASLSLSSIVSRGLLPIIVGGSNSFIEALVDDDDNKFRSRFDCCFLWVDVSIPVLDLFVSKRVDRMIDTGMVEEVRNLFDGSSDYSRGNRKAIGVPEFHRYFRAESCGADEEIRARLLEEAIEEVKLNTYKLMRRQLGKIHRLRTVKGWKIHRLDATEVFLKQGKEADEAWQKLVDGPSAIIVRRFLHDFRHKVYAAGGTGTTVRTVGIEMSMAAATH